MQPGDLLVFSKLRSKRISHVGIYVGDGMMIHASAVSKAVVETPILEYRSALLRGVRRVISVDSAKGPASRTSGSNSLAEAPHPGSAARVFFACDRVAHPWPRRPRRHLLVGRTIASVTVPAAQSLRRAPPPDPIRSRSAASAASAVNRWHSLPRPPSQTRHTLRDSPPRIRWPSAWEGKATGIPRWPHRLRASAQPGTPRMRYRARRNALPYIATMPKF